MLLPKRGGKGRAGARDRLTEHQHAHETRQHKVEPSHFEDYPLSVGLYSFMTKYDIEWNLLMAAALVVTLPMAIIFFLAQRQFIEGVTLTGIKG